MGRFEAAIRLVIHLCFILLAFALCIWVLGQLGIVIPTMVVKIFLFAILVLVRLFAPFMGSFNLFPPRQ